MKLSRSPGYDGSSGKYAPPDLNTPTTEIAVSIERPNNTPITGSLRKHLERICDDSRALARSSPLYVRASAPEKTAIASGAADTRLPKISNTVMGRRST